MTAPSKFRKKPIVITALQWTGHNLDEMREFTGGKFGGPTEDATALVYDELHDTWVGVNLHDWIIRGVKGEFYPCRADVFAETYEADSGFKPAIPDEAVDILVDRWHDADPGSAVVKLELHELLGMTWDQYKTWVGSGGLGLIAGQIAADKERAR